MVIKMNIKKLVRRLFLGYKGSSEDYINHLRKKGVVIGDDVTIYRPFNTTIDPTSPHLLSIGSHVVITGPVTILTHDYSWAVLKNKYGEVLGNERKTRIGSNVFIGWGAIILGGADIGDNVIIGAGSVISGKIESNSVYGGNPARKIMSLEEFYEKRKNAQLAEAKSFVVEFRNCYGKDPAPEDLDEYFFLFSNKLHNKRFDFQLSLTENYEESNRIYESHQPMFENFEEFLRFCKDK